MEQAIPCSSRSVVAVPFVDDAYGNEKDNKDGVVVGGKQKNVQYCPHTHNIKFFKQVTMYDVRTYIFMGRACGAYGEG